MNQVVTLTAHFPATGEKNGKQWKRHDFKDAGGNKFQTFDNALGEKAAALLRQQAEIEYEVEPRGDYQNNVIRSIRAVNVEAAPAQESVNAGNAYDAGPVNAGFFGSDRPIRSHETNRSDALGHAVAFAGEGIAANDLFTLADAFVRYIETGSAVEADTFDDNPKF